jgi:hypothetical protein
MKRVKPVLKKVLIKANNSLGFFESKFRFLFFLEYITELFFILGLSSEHFIGSSNFNDGFL